MPPLRLFLGGRRATLYAAAISTFALNERERRTGNRSVSPCVRRPCFARPLKPLRETRDRLVRNTGRRRCISVRKRRLSTLLVARQPPTTSVARLYTRPDFPGFTLYGRLISPNRLHHARHASCVYSSTTLRESPHPVSVTDGPVPHRGGRVDTAEAAGSGFLGRPLRLDRYVPQSRGIMSLFCIRSASPAPRSSDRLPLLAFAAPVARGRAVPFTRGQP